MHSTAQASGIAAASFPPHASAAARHNAGRTRLPPANSEYRIALWIVAGLVLSFGRNLSSAAFTALVLRSRYAARSKRPRAVPAFFLTSDMRGFCRETFARKQAIRKTSLSKIPARQSAPTLSDNKTSRTVLPLLGERDGVRGTATNLNPDRTNAHGYFLFYHPHAIIPFATSPATAVTRE